MSARRSVHDQVEDILESQEVSTAQRHEKAQRLQQKYGSGGFSFTSVTLEETPSDAFFGVSATARAKNADVELNFSLVRLESGEWPISI